MVIQVVQRLRKAQLRTLLPTTLLDTDRLRIPRTRANMAHLRLTVAGQLKHPQLFG
jgi:hypothetical protein